MCLTAIILSLPETARRIVGNGSNEPRSIYRTPFCKPTILLNDDGERPLASRILARIPNPLVTLRLLLRIDIAFVIVSIGVFYTTYSCLQASLATLFMEEYGYGELEAGVIYLPFGIGCALTAYLTGILQVIFTIFH